MEGGEVVPSRTLALEPGDAGADDGAPSWLLTLPRVQLQGELEQVGPAVGGTDGGRDADGPVLRWLEGTLRLAGRSVRAAGVHVETGTP